MFDVRSIYQNKGLEFYLLAGISPHPIFNYANSAFFSCFVWAIDRVIFVLELNRHFGVKSLFCCWFLASYVTHIKTEPREVVCDQNQSSTILPGLSSISRTHSTYKMENATDSSSYMKMMSETHAPANSPLVYSCGTQPSSFHCVKAYRQLYDGMAAYEAQPSPYPGVKQEPIDYSPATCENPYEQGKTYFLNVFQIQYFVLICLESCHICAVFFSTFFIDNPNNLSVYICVGFFFGFSHPCKSRDSWEWCCSRS